MNAKDRRNDGLAFGAALRAARKRKGVTQEQLAHAADLDRTYGSMLERGIRTPTIATVLQLAEALGLPASTLIDETLAQLRNEGPLRNRSIDE